MHRRVLRFVLIGFFALLSAFAPVYLLAEEASTTVSTTPDIATSSSATTPSTTPLRNIHNAADVEAKVRLAFPDAPIMAAVAKCESKFRQFTDGGSVFKGGLGSQMVGVFQIHEGVHRSFANSHGFNIDTVEGNIAYARYLYDREGTTPWVSSFPCWNDKGEEGSTGTNSSSAAASPTSSGLTINLTLGMVHPEVATLQKILNQNGFTLAAEGPGSPGNETIKFGALTKTMIRKFQCEKKIVCGGNEYSTGYGFVGPKTRQALLSLNGSTETVAVASTKKDPPEPAVGNSSSISALKAQIAELTKQLEELQKKLSIAQSV